MDHLENTIYTKRTERSTLENDFCRYGPAMLLVSRRLIKRSQTRLNILCVSIILTNVHPLVISTNFRPRALNYIPTLCFGGHRFQTHRYVTSSLKLLVSNILGRGLITSVSAKYT